jgi:hypothetical protein
MELTGRQWEQLSEALRSAFDRARLERMLRFRLDKRLEDIALGNDLEEIAFDVIERAEAEGWTSRLVVAARDSVPDNAKLLAIAQQFGLASTGASTQQLEQTIKATNSYLDVETWRSNLGRLEPRVCRIRVPVQGGAAFGTGFLVASDLLLTNYHVVEAVIMGEQGKASADGPSAAARDVVSLFDYKRLSDGGVVSEGIEHKLAADWLVHSSPFSNSDFAGADGALPTLDELDFALLRLEQEVGHEEIGGSAEPGAASRGWIGLPSEPNNLPEHSPLFILQHPQGDPLKLALDTDAIVEVNANGTRVLYRTNTEPGSSGSPCFDANWELIALHHSGDPNYDGIKPPQYNRGIPITAIAEHLDRHGLRQVLSAPTE